MGSWFLGRFRSDGVVVAASSVAVIAALTASLNAGICAAQKAEVQPTDAKPTDAKPRRPSILINVVGLKNRQGRVGCALFDQKRHWLTPKAIDGVKTTVGKNMQVQCEFRNVKPGRYAIAITHDEDNDGEVDRGLFGIPSEGYCTSRNAKANFGPPTWDDAVFTHGEQKPTWLRAKIRY